MNKRGWLLIGPFGRNEAFGILLQERLACYLEEILPEWVVFSFKTHGDDLLLQHQDNGAHITGEVKSAKELFYNKHDKGAHRGQFSIQPHQFRVDFYAFIIRFVDWDPISLKYRWNNDLEWYFCTKESLETYLLGEKYANKPIPKWNYKLHISELQKVNVKQNPLPILEEICPELFLVHP